MTPSIAIDAIAEAPRIVRPAAWAIGAMLASSIAAAIFTPWQQSVSGEGRVVAFAPIERQQTIDTPVDGRVARWHVVEGQRVKKGDRIADLEDNDPGILERMRQEREALGETIHQSRQRTRSMEARIQGLDEVRTHSVAAARERVRMAAERVEAAQQGLAAAEAGRMTAGLHIERQKRLGSRGLTSTRTVEVAEMDFRKAVAEMERARATLAAARSEKQALDSEMIRADAEARTRLDEGWGQRASAESDVAKANAELTRLEVRLARQSSQSVVSPADGTIFRVIARQGGEFLKAGAPLALLVPVSGVDVVELMVRGNDMPLVRSGRKARLQFEGWPAVQFVGWPSAAVGTFGGEVLFVDPADNGKGEFRVLIKPDSSDEPWPSKSYLRQGVRANGWILLNEVPVWFELWRIFNGFPPTVPAPEAGPGAQK